MRTDSEQAKLVLARRDECIRNRKKIKARRTALVIELSSCAAYLVLIATAVIVISSLGDKFGNAAQPDFDSSKSEQYSSDAPNSTDLDIKIPVSDGDSDLKTDGSDSIPLDEDDNGQGKRYPEKSEEDPLFPLRLFRYDYRYSE